MSNLDIKKIVENLIKTFLEAGKVSLELRKKGLIKKIKSDNTPVTNGDIEVNKIVTNRINQLTPDIPIVSEETSENKTINNFIEKCYLEGVDKINVITGKGSRSKNKEDPYQSVEFGILKYSVPNYIKNNINLMKIIKEIDFVFEYCDVR